MQVIHQKEQDANILQENKETLNECFEVYKKLLGAQQIRKKLNMIHQQHSFFTQSQSSQSKYKSVIRQHLQENLADQHISLPDNQSLQQHFIHSHQQFAQKEYQITQLIQLNQQIAQKQHQMLQKQAQYKELMKRHYKFVRPNKAQQMFHKFVKDKLLKNIQNVQHQMQELYQIGGRSSISSSSFGGNHAIEDWVHQQKQQKLLKEQQKLVDQILILEKQLEQIQ